MSGAALCIEHLHVEIDGRKILRDVSFQAEQGEFIGIIGPNGAGKSTLLRAVRGLIQSAGTVTLFAENLSGMPDKKAARRIAYMQQNINVDFGFTAMEVVLAGRYPYLDWWSSEKAEDIAVAEKYMKFTGVYDFKERSVQSLSGGERQRVLLAKVLAQETPLIFLDEPTASLDLTYQEEIFRCCKRLCLPEEGGKLIVMVVHDLEMAAKFCSRLILVSQGAIVADGIPEDVITSENLEVAYGLRAKVFENPISGALDLYTHQDTKRTKPRAHAFVFGAGAVGTEWIRLLFEHGYQVSGGIFRGGEIDAATAEIFGVEGVFLPQGMEPSTQEVEAVREKLLAADFVVLPQLQYGKEQLYILEIAHLAKYLYIVEDTPFSKRDFSGGEAASPYAALTLGDSVRRISSIELRRLLAAGVVLPECNREDIGECRTC